MSNFQFITSHEYLFFVISFSLVTASILSFKKNASLSILLLVLSTFFIGIFIATLDPYLNLWDEQYHALVAKNLSKDFLSPKLFSSPLFDFDYTNWTSNSIWLHKQPLFLWQMALSIKLFGVSELSVRIPSIIMHAIIPYFIYRIGKITYSKETGFYGALLFGFAFYPLELVVGKYSTDHNDLAFLFYVSASFWAWFEYNRTGKTFWLILVGVFSGGAVLIKWLMGLLIYIVWFLTKLISEPQNRFKPKTYLPLVFSGMISLAIFLPWQLYIIYKYPTEAFYEYLLNSKHFYEVIEGHGEHLWFHFTEALGEIYGTGDLIPIVLLISITLFVKNISNRTYKIAIIISILFVYFFYTIAKTKMLSFTIIVSPFIFLSFGFMVNLILNWIQKKTKNVFITAFFTFTLPLFITFSFFDLNKIKFKHTDKIILAKKKKERLLISHINKKLSKDYIIFNCTVTLNGNIPIMFYTENTAYDFIPTQEQIDFIFKQGKKIAILNDNKLPSYIRENSTIHIIKLP